MTQTEARKFIKTLAAVYQLTAKFNCRKNMQPNHGACAGREVYLGVFDDPDIMMAAFLHELGHILGPGVSMKRWMWKHNSYLLRELKAWNKAMDLAWKHRIPVPDKAWAWGYTQALTYSYWFENEQGKTMRRIRNAMYNKLADTAKFFSRGRFLKKAKDD